MTDLTSKVQLVADNLLRQGASLCVVESCTGGGLGGAITSLPGSSAWFYGGFITYANEAKMKHVYVRESTLQQSGAVSEDCVKEMANGGMIASNTSCCLSISGVAGPDGGTPGKPVGTVWMGLAIRHKAIEAFEFHFEGDRASIREQAIQKALEILSNVSLKKTV